jgi:DNA-binding MarR family transcriptional regulator
MPRADADRLAAWEAARVSIARVERDVEQRLEAERKLDLSTYDVMAALVNAGGRMRMHELADALVLGRPTTTRTCDRLEAQGFVRRERPEQDGRAVFVVLTREGREEYRRCQPAYERFVNDAFGRHVTESDVASLVRIAGKLE